MSDSYEAETDVSDSELEDYVDRWFNDLMQDKGKVKLSENVYRCPFCPGKKKMVYQSKDLLQHASDLGRSTDLNHRGKHLAVLRFLKDDIRALSSDFSTMTLDHSRSARRDKLFVYPWMGILANVDARSLSDIRDDLARRGFDHVKVRIPRSGCNHAVAAFKRDWSGFYSCIVLDREFEANGRGRRDYYIHRRSSSGGTTELGNGMYGWIAEEEDYENAEGAVGEFLRKNGDLKSVSQVEGDERRKTRLMISDL
ncbi:hypothetical protein M569_12161, partial [Genlisea aurea]